ncbi:MAG: type II toxin-antitoxin system VapC family toxin [Burkholderiaceae bacterium]
MKRYLLDTHVVLWALTEPRRLSPATRDILNHAPVYVSAVSVWEALLKHSQGRLRLPDGSLINAIERAGAQFLPLRPEHAESAAALGSMHGDPMDRLLIGSARVEGMVLLTRDAEILSRAGPLLGNLLMEA